MVRVSRDLWQGGGGGGCSVHVPIHVLSRDGQSILGHSDKEGWCDLAQCMYILRMARHHWTYVAATGVCRHSGHKEDGFCG